MVREVETKAKAKAKATTEMKFGFKFDDRAECGGDTKREENGVGNIESGKSI